MLLRNAKFMFNTLWRYNKKFKGSLANKISVEGVLNSLLDEGNFEEKVKRLGEMYFLMMRKNRDQIFQTKFQNFIHETFFQADQKNNENFMAFTRNFFEIFQKIERSNPIFLIFLRVLNEITQKKGVFEPEFQRKLTQSVLKNTKNLNANFFQSDSDGIFKEILLERLRNLKEDDEKTKDILFAKAKKAFALSSDRCFCEDLLEISLRSLRLKQIKKLLKSKGWNIEDFPKLQKAVSLEFFYYKFKNCISFWEVEEFYQNDQKMLSRLVQELYSKHPTIAFSIYKRNSLIDNESFFTRRNDINYRSFFENDRDVKVLENPFISNDYLKPMEVIFLESQKKQGNFDYLTLEDYGIGESNIYFINTIENLKKCENELVKQRIIGVDIENLIKDRSPSLLQLATEDKQIYLVDMLKLKNCEELWLFVNKIFEVDNLKIGQGLANDLDCLRKANNFKMKIDLNNFIDIQKLFKIKYPDETQCSLAFIVGKILGKKLSKEERMGNWGKRPLRKYQMHYAALDGYLMIELYKKLK